MGCCGLHVDLWGFLGKILVGVGIKGSKLSQCSLRLEFYKLGQIEVNVCHCNGTWWGQHMCMTFNDSKWLQSYVYFIAFMFFSGTYVCQVMQLSLLKSRLADSALFSTLCCRICPACWFYGWHIPQHSPLSVSGIPLAFPIDSRFCWVCTAQDCPKQAHQGRAYLAESTVYNPLSTHFLVQKSHWVSSQTRTCPLSPHSLVQKSHRVSSPTRKPVAHLLKQRIPNMEGRSYFTSPI